ncbi:MAG: hypothetical protein V3V35_06130 [Dehalococcoidia bacterium]
MKLELTPEESRELLDAVVDTLIEEVEMSDGDLATIKRWRSETMKIGSERMRELTDKMNSDLERVLRTKEKSAVRKPDWS